MGKLKYNIDGTEVKEKEINGTNTRMKRKGSVNNDLKAIEQYTKMEKLEKLDSNNQNKNNRPITSNKKTYTGVFKSNIGTLEKCDRNTDKLEKKDKIEKIKMNDINSVRYGLNYKK